jgi:hypothetical protein
MTINSNQKFDTRWLDKTNAVARLAFSAALPQEK